MVSFARASRFAVFAVVLTVLALGLAATQSVAAPIASANDDAQPQLFAPNPAWDWNNDGCPDVIDTFQRQPQLRVGDCIGGTWKSTGDALQFPLNDIYDE